MKKIGIRDIVLAGILSALVFVVTAFTKIPSPFVKGAYYHAGDSIIFMSALVMNPLIAGLIGGVGSFFADLYLGSAMYMIPTLIIKFVMGLVAGSIMNKRSKELWGSNKPTFIKALVASVIAALFMVIGYYVFEVFIIRVIDWRANLSNLVGNLVQAGVGVIIFLVLFPAVNRMNLR